MTIEYHIPPSENFDTYRQVVTVGSECQFHGYIKDFNEATRRYIVVVRFTPYMHYATHSN